MMKDLLQSRGDDGVSTVELAIILPLLMALFVGTLEFGIAFRDDLTLQTAVRNSTRVATNGQQASDTTRKRLADFNLLQSLDTSIDGISDAEIERIVVWRADGVADDPPAACKTALVGSVINQCNVYGGTFPLFPTLADFGGDDLCDAGEPDEFYCPATRNYGTDFIGVWVKVNNATITKIFGASITITDGLVMQLEPQIG